jgi:hypothetical protein
MQDQTRDCEKAGGFSGFLYIIWDIGFGRSQYIGGNSPDNPAYPAYPLSSYPGDRPS